MSRFLSCLQHSRPCSCIGYTNSRLRLEFVYTAAHVVNITNLIPKIDTSLNYQLRNNKKIHVPKFYTERFKNSYVIASCLDINNRNSTN